MHIAIGGDEGGTSQSPLIGQKPPQTAKASKRPNFSFSESDPDFSEEVPKGVTFEDRQAIKKELAVSAAEMKKLKAAERKKKLAEDYEKNRDPIQEFFKLTCQSIKINSPHMNLIALINSDKLYK